MAPMPVCEGSDRRAAQAFEQAALALTAIVTDAEDQRAERGRGQLRGARHRAAPGRMANAIIYEMAVRNMVFGRFEVDIERYAS